jgi:hypothetical protein
MPAVPAGASGNSGVLCSEGSVRGVLTVQCGTVPTLLWRTARVKRLLSALLIAPGRDAWRLFLRNRTRRRRGSCAAHDPLTRPAALSRARTLPRELWRSDRLQPSAMPTAWAPRTPSGGSPCRAGGRAAPDALGSNHCQDILCRRLLWRAGLCAECRHAPGFASWRASAGLFTALPFRSRCALHCTALSLRPCRRSSRAGCARQTSSRRRSTFRYPAAHICAGTGLTPPTSAPGPGSPAPTSAPGPGSPRPHLRRDSRC